MPAVGPLSERWYAKPDGAAHSEVVAIAESLWQDDSGRRARYLRSLETYEGRRLGNLSALSYQRVGVTSQDAPGWNGNGYDELYWNVSRLLCKTAQAKIAGRQKPKPQFVASNADWATKRRAKKLDRFVEAQMMAPQGGHEDVWAMAVRVFLDAVVFGIGWIKVSSDWEEAQVSLERVFPWEVLVDPVEAEKGQPQNLFHVTAWDKDKLAAIYPEHAAAIRAAKPYELPGQAQGKNRVAESLKVYEAWHLPPSSDEPGHWMRCIDGATLESGDWTRKEFPFLPVYWQREMIGAGGTSLVEEVQPLADELNFCVERIKECEHMTSKAVCFYQEGTVEQSDLRSNEDWINIPVSAGASMMPNYVSPAPFSQQSIDWINLNWGKTFELSGISQMTATARKEAGITSGVALRTVADQQSELFSVVDRAYQQLFPALARHIVACTRELADQHRDFAVRWPGGKFLQTLKWSEVDLAEDQYVIQVYPVSEIKNTPADRLQLAQELNASGKLSDDALIRVIQYLDAQSEFDSLNKQQELIGKYIEEWLDYTPEKMASGEFRYRAPIPIGLNHEAAIVQVAQAYLDAQLEEAPDDNLEFFLRFIEECDQHIQEKAKKLAEIQAMAAGKAAPPMPGAPAAPAPMAGAPPGMAA